MKGIFERFDIFYGISKLIFLNSGMIVLCLCWYIYFKYMYYVISCKVNRGIKSNSDRGKVKLYLFYKRKLNSIICILILYVLKN